MRIRMFLIRSFFYLYLDGFNLSVSTQLMRVGHRFLVLRLQSAIAILSSFQTGYYCERVNVIYIKNRTYGLKSNQLNKSCI